MVLYGANYEKKKTQDVSNGFAAIHMWILHKE